MPVSSQNTLTSRETATSCTFPFGRCHHQPCTASPTLCKVHEYASYHSKLSMSPCTSSHIMNCPMFRTVGVGGQMSCPCTLTLHCQIVRRHLANERAMQCSATYSYQGTSSSKIPWTANCNQHVVCQVWSTVSSVSCSSPMSMQYPVHCPGLPPGHSSLPSAEDQWPMSSH